MLKYYVRRLCLSLYLATIPLVFVAQTHSAEPIDQADLDQAGLTDPAHAERIAELIRGLDAPQFADRNAASRQLQQLGPAVCPALADTAVSGSREQRNRALGILEQLFQDGQPAAREAAQQALEAIASSDHEASARRANKILEPKQEPPAALMRNVVPGQIQIQMNAIAGGIGGRAVQRMMIRDGVKQIETDDGQRKIKVVEDPKKGIEVEITEKKDGEDQTEKFQVKDGKELAERHPDAHALYQRMQQGGGIRIQAIQAPAAPIPVPLGGRPQGLDLQRQTVHRMLQSSHAMLEKSIQQLELSKGEGEEAKQIEASIERLREISEQLKAESARLEAQ